MSHKSEAYARLTLSIVLFTLACFMPNVLTISFISLVALHSLVSGLIRLRNK